MTTDRATLCNGAGGGGERQGLTVVLASRLAKPWFFRPGAKDGLGPSGAIQAGPHFGERALDLRSRLQKCRLRDTAGWRRERDV